MNLNDVVDEPFYNSDLVVQLVGIISDESDNVVEVKKNLLLNEPRKHSKDKRLPKNKNQTRLWILSHQRKAHHPKESCFRTDARTG